MTVALCTLALSAALLPGVLPGLLPASAAVSPTAAGPDLTLVSQTQWVTPAAPWFSLALAVGSQAGSAADLHVSVTMYGRITDGSQFQQAANGVPQEEVLTRVPDVGVTATAAGLTAATCITVLYNDTSGPPTPAPGTAGVCPSGGPTVNLHCTLGSGPCDDVYPVSIALLHAGDSTPVARFTTFLTYEEPGIAQPPATGGPLRVSWIVPVQNRVSGQSPAADVARQSTEALATELSARRNVPTTLAVNPTTAADLATYGGKAGQSALRQLAELAPAAGPDQLLAPPFAPIDLAALSAAGLAAEIPLQLDRGTQILHATSLQPSGGSWVETGANLSNVDVGNLTTGLQAAGANQLVVSDAALAPIDNPTGSTFAQPFTLALAHGTHVNAVASDSQVDARFTANPRNPTLAANQLLANLSFIHFENQYDPNQRGVVLVPPTGWRPSSVFVSTFLAGLTNSQIVSPVTLDQQFAQVPVGGNRAPTSRRLQSGDGVGRGGITATAAARIRADRAELNSFSAAASGHPSELTALSDALLRSQSEGLSAPERGVVLTAYGLGFTAMLSSISLAVERTITFTSRTASIPITVLSAAPFVVRVVLTLSSDKFTFPNGATRTMDLNHSTTSVRIAATARTSGDRLPVDVTLRTPDGGLTISRTVLTVQSTALSIVGIALTVLAGLVLLAWWVRTWRRSRQRRPRAH
jgi:Family of unknown function (DUF6049)